MTFVELALASFLALSPVGPVDAPGSASTSLPPALPVMEVWSGEAPAADTLPGMAEGRRAAGEYSTRGSFLRGVGWGTVLGPAGGIIAMRREAAREVLPPEHAVQALGNRPSAYREGFVVGWQAGNLEKRRESSVIGSMVGTIAFLGIIFLAMDLGQTDQSILPPEEGLETRVRGPAGGGFPVLSLPFAVGGR